MKKYLITTLLILGILGITEAQAQHHVPRADRKGRKMDKKEWKIHRKMFNDRPGKAARKENKSRKKEYKKHYIEQVGE